MQISNTHQKFTKEDYEELEKVGNDLFQKEIYDEVYNNQTSNNSLIVDNLDINKFRYCKLKKLIEEFKLDIVIKRIPLVFEDLGFTYKDIIDYKNKKKNKFDKRTLIRTNEEYNNMDLEVVKINEFCDRIMNRIFINIKQELMNINFNEYTFYYMVIYLLKFSEKGKNKKNKKTDSWRLDLPDILNIEIIKTLIELDSNISKQLLDCFNSSNIINDILINYPDIIFNPLILNKIVFKDNQINLRDEQKIWISQYKDLVNKLYEHIINGEEMVPTNYYNTAGMGAGKSYLTSVGLTIIVKDTNIKMKNYDKSIVYKERLFTLKKRMIILFIVPSKQVLLSFGKNTANYVSTWFYNGNPSQINIMFNSTPVYSKGKKKVHFQYSKEANQMDVPVYEKFLNIILWHRLHKKNLINKRGESLWVGGHDYFKEPDVIFCDPKGAEELIANKFDFEQRLGWYFIPVVDEWVATADCNIEKENNHYLNSIKNIVKSNIKLKFLISASINKNEILNNSYLNRFQSLFAPVVPTVNSLTEMYTYSGDLVHPFSMVKYKKINEAIDSWDFTVYRCITPKVLIEYCSILNYTLEYDDIKNINNYIATVKKILDLIKRSNDEIKKNICDIKLEKYDNNIKNFKTLYLTSSSVGDEIYRYIDTKLSKNTILKKINDNNNHINNEIIELRNEIIESKALKKKSQEGNADEINQKIFDLEKRLESDDQLFYFSSNFGKTTVTKKWIDEWINKLNDYQLTVVLSGYDLSFDDKDLDDAAKDVIRQPIQIVDTISSMFGRNDQSINDLVINDKNKILGPKTMMQAFARAGRSGKYNCLVTTICNKRLLKKFNYEESSINKYFNEDD